LKKSSTWHIQIKGQVQGVGFRPFVYQLAQKFQLKGWIKNTADGIHIAFNADRVDAEKFYDEVVINPPQLAHITSHSLKKISSVTYEDFEIISSSNQGNSVLLISPDFAMCEDCRKEISDKNNRRYNYAFTTCTQCGPRYSIIKLLPYDRDKTTMDVLEMCSICNEEYIDPTNRRHFSQTNSCPDCGVLMKLLYSNQGVIEKTIRLLKSSGADEVWRTGDKYNWTLEKRVQELNLSEDEKKAMNIEISNFIKHSTKNELQNIISGKKQFSEGEIIQTTARYLRGSKEAGGMAEEKQFTKEIISKICELWNDGKIVALKGIGGYLLTCDASNETVIKELRLRKHRPAKPFALMFPDITLLQSVVHINEQEQKELQSAAAPIVLLELKEDADSSLALHEIAPRLSKVGVMLPYAPLYELLLQQFSKPIVATSGNISNAPIVFEDETALNELNVIADYILVHNREIISPQDDSVITYSLYSQQRIVLRRARGFAPFYFNSKLPLPGETILATGAVMKSSFTLLHQQNIHISQYLGDTDNYDGQKNFEKTLHHFLHLFRSTPEVILIDKHPGYFTSGLGEQLAKKWNSQLVKVQHHKAHFASVLGEHNLLNETEPVLGVVWDGTGFGNDGQIWGGEFFVYHRYRFSRVAHFDYFNHFLGDKMATEPRLSAFSLCHEIEEAPSILQPKFSAAEWNNYNQLIKTNELKTSSVGRIFDAVASLLGLIDKASYEGEAAMLLEEEALGYFNSKLDVPDAWLNEDALENPLSTSSLVREIAKKIKDGNDKPEIAAWFHVQLVLAVKSIAAFHQCRKICFSGGVFQNGLLIDLLIALVGKKYQLYFNKDMSPNDENISFGQLMWFTMMKKGASTK